MIEIPMNSYGFLTCDNQSFNSKETCNMSFNLFLAIPEPNFLIGMDHAEIRY